MSLPIVSLNKFNVICRACLKETQTLTSLYDESIGANLVTKFKTCTSVQFDINDGLPEKLCHSCIKELLAANNFAYKCKISDTTLRKCLIQHHNSVLPQNDHEEHLGGTTAANTLSIPENDFTSNYDFKTILISQPEMLTTNSNSIVIAKKSEIIYDSEPKEVTESIDIGYDPATDNFDDDTSNVDVSYSNYKSQSNSRELRIQLVKIDVNVNSSDLNSHNQKNKTTNQSHLSGQRKRYSCELCSYTCRRFSSFKHHKQSHEKDLKDVAAPTSKDDSQKKENKQEEALLKKIYKCDKCNKAYCYPNALETHKMLYCLESKLKCNICFKIFRDISSLKSHKKLHMNKKKFPCDVCSKTLRSANSFMQHKLIHSGVKPFSCPICKKSFYIAQSLVVHQQVHTDYKPYACNICGKRFLWVHNFNRHKIIHTNNKSYACSTCNSRFKHAFSLSRHKEKMHGVKCD